MNKQSAKVVARIVVLIALVPILFFLVIYFRPEVLLTDRSMRGLKFSLRARLMNLAFDAGLMNESRDNCRVEDIREFLIARNGSREGFWVSGKKYDVQYKLNMDIDAWICTGKVDWIIQAKVSCATNLVFKMYSNFDVLPMPVEGEYAAPEYERFILSMGGLAAFEEECDNVLKNVSRNVPLGGIPVPPKLATLGAQGLKQVYDNGKAFLIVYLDKDRSSGFVRLMEGDSRIKLGVYFGDKGAIRLDERIWWFGDVYVMRVVDEAYFILHGGDMRKRPDSFSGGLLDCMFLDWGQWDMHCRQD